MGPPLDRFYNALSDEQKARLNAANEQERRNRGSLASCGAVSNATRWPGEQIEKAVRPDPGQQAKLDALKAAMDKAAGDLADACPSALPATPPARLRAISMRLNAMLQTVKNVRIALDGFYDSLSDEQKMQVQHDRPAADRAKRAKIELAGRKASRRPLISLRRQRKPVTNTIRAKARSQVGDPPKFHGCLVDHSPYYLHIECVGSSKSY